MPNKELRGAGAPAPQDTLETEDDELAAIEMESKVAVI
jgi:hypothetical protein